MSRTERVVVMSPQTRLARSRRRGRPGLDHLQLDPGRAERARALYRAQWRPGLITLALLGILLAGMPLAFVVWPVLDEIRVAGVPLSWLLLGVLPYPVLTGLALWQLRRAESAEDRR